MQLVLLHRFSQQYDVRRISFFGDFTRASLRKYVDDIRKITNNIIDTQNGSNKIVKDYSDFIMLDGIYQDIDRFPKTNTYILFTGDGHFASVASYIKNIKKKHLAIYGINKSMSNKLRDIADDVCTYPSQEQMDITCQKLILRNLDELSRQPRITYPTFSGTLQAVAHRYNIPEENIKAALEQLARQGIISRELAKVGFRQIYVLRINWDIAKNAGLWAPTWWDIQSSTQPKDA